jgi:hypothetical protein
MALDAATPWNKEKIMNASVAVANVVNGRPRG